MAISEKYQRRIDYLKDAYANPEFREFLDNDFKYRHPNAIIATYGKRTDSIINWLKDIEIHEAEYQEVKCMITLFYDDLRVYRGELTDEERFKHRPERIWNKPYLTRKVGIPYEKDEDFFSIDISYYFRSDISNEELKKLVYDSDFRKDGIDAAYEKLQRSKKFKNVDKSYMAIKKMICRYQYKELLMIIGLRKEILDIKETMQEELNKD